MHKFSNDNSVSVHLTKGCNLKCKHCYQEEFVDKANFERILLGIDTLNPENILFYGGEPMVRQQMIKDIMDKYPNKGTILHTNGTIWNKEIFDKVDVIYITLESFIFEEMKKYRPINRQQYDNIIRLLEEYKHKMWILHNIYPWGHDKTFYKTGRLYGVPIHSYPIVTTNTELVFDEESVKHIITKRYPLIKPKLRVLENGTITRDMRGIINICQPEDWKEEYRNFELPIGDKCKNCEYFTECPACNMFPHFCNDVLKKVESPHFCKYTKELHLREFYK